MGSLSTSKPSRLSTHDAAVAVAGVLAQADVGDEDQLFRGARLLERAQRLLHDAVFVPGAGGLFVFAFRQAEEQQAADAQLRGFFGLAHRLIHGEIEDAGHGADGVAHALAGADERADRSGRRARARSRAPARAASRCAAAAAAGFQGNCMASIVDEQLLASSL